MLSSLRFLNLKFTITTVCPFLSSFCPHLSLYSHSWYVNILPYRLALIPIKVISPSEKILPARLNMELIEQLQTVIAPQIFSPRAVYDTRKNLFSCHPLKLGPSNSQEVMFCFLLLSLFSYFPSSSM